MTGFGNSVVKCLTDWEDNVHSRVDMETGLLEDMVTIIAFTWEGRCVAR